MVGTTPNTFTGTSCLHEGVLELYKFFNQEHVPSIVGNFTVGYYGGEILRYGGPGQIGDTAQLIVDSAGTVEMQGWSDLIGALSGAGEVDLGAGGALTVGGSNLSTTFSGEMAGSASLVKPGASAFVLSGVNTDTGNTLIEEGSLPDRLQSRMCMSWRKGLFTLSVSRPAEPDLHR
jgi:autotransporter-associated beta strand protein